MRTFVKLITVVAAFGLVAACAGTDDGKKMAAKGGKDLTAMFAGELSAGQKRLKGALRRGGATKSPKHAAEAQKKIGCWIAQAKAGQKKKATACKSSFYGAMALLEADVFAPPPKAKKKAKKKGAPRTKHFLVFFGLDSAAISGREAKTVANAAKFAFFNKGSNVYVTGHADQSGSRDYNMKLAKKRTDAVVKDLIGLGIKKKGIGAVNQGESDPAVSRSGGKDPRNRRVVISIIY
jgi:outer membrane protein OmpA-like peptidoglycan-associated protein